MITVESQRGIRSAPILPATTKLGPVRIGVTNRERALFIWRDVVGLNLIAEDEKTLHLGIDGRELITLDVTANLPVKDHSLGLYHVAIHVPTRAALAQMVVRALQRRVRVSPTDHLVSEAVYLWDFDNNGIEITFETPWRGRIGTEDEGLYVITADGQPHSGREAIDLDDLLGELGETPVLEAAMPSGTRIGHIHLHVRDLDESMHFYRDAIGFGGLFIMRRFGMGDLGLDYPPHTIAFNIWAGPNATQLGPDHAGLRHYDLVLPDEQTLAGVSDRLKALGRDVETLGNGLSTLDPAGNRLRLVLA